MSGLRCLLAISTTILLAGAGCGRADFTWLREAPDGGLTGNGPGPGPGPRDADYPGEVGPVPWDASHPIWPDATDPGQSECRTPGDCWARYGPPQCDRPGNAVWICEEQPCPATVCPRRCVAECEPEPACRTDCDCEDWLGCEQGRCMAVNRRNLCCTSRFCPPGQRCVLPSGGVGTCPGGPPIPDGGPPPFPDAAPNPERCANDCECDSSQNCVRGRCRYVNTPNSCCLYSTCRPGRSCVYPDGSRGTCPQTTANIGAPCQGGTCGPGAFCIEDNQGFPGGYCSQACQGSGMCPPGGVCRDVGGRQPICLDECATAMDCRSGYGCLRLGVGTERMCWPVSGGSSNPGGDPVGSECEDDDDCAVGLTCFEGGGGGGGGGGFRDGYCSIVYCDPQTRPCPVGSQCYAFPGIFAMCLAECPNGGTRSTCRSGYYCLGPTGQPGVCISN